MQNIEHIARDVRGMSTAIASGLVTLRHPDQVEIYNVKSKGAMQHLGYAIGTLEAFEHSAHALKELLGADDFLQLDLFLYLITEGRYKESIRQVVKIAPGEEGRLWEECLKGGYICVG